MKSGKFLTCGNITIAMKFNRQITEVKPTELGFSRFFPDSFRLLVKYPTSICPNEKKSLNLFTFNQQSYL